MSNEIQIRISGDGRAFIAETGKATTAIDHLADAANKTNTDMQRGAEQTGKAVREMGTDVGVAAATAGASLERMEIRLRQTARTGEISAAQTAAAMRQLPAQMTDIATQLAGGQNPLLILLQQGGQIKDSFGGIGPAIKGITAALNPFSVAMGASAIAAGALAFAFYSGSREAQEFNKALAFTNNITGVTTYQLADMSRHISEGIGTQSAAAEALALIAGSGKIAADSMERYGEVAILANKAVGKEVKQTVSEFAALAEAPVAGSIKLNETYHYLTAAVLEQIDALEKQGRTQEAVKLAQDTFANATDKMSRQVIENIGDIERAWRGLKSTVAGVWDDMLNVERKSTPAQELASLQAQLKATQTQLKNTPEGSRRSDYGNRVLDDQGTAQPRQDLLAREKFLKGEIDRQLEIQRLAGKQSAILAEQNRIREDGVAAFAYLSKASEDAAEKQEKYNKALAKEREMQDKLRKSTPDSPLLKAAEIAKREAKIHKDIYGDEKKSSTRGLIQAPTEDAVAALRAKINAANEAALGIDKLNEGERETLRIEQQLQVAIARGASAKVQSGLQAQLASAKTLAVQLDVNAALEAQTKERAKLKESRDKELEQLRQTASEWELKLRYYGMEKSAIDEAKLATVEALIVDKENQLAMGANNRLLEEEVAHLRKKAELMRTAVNNRAAVEDLDAAAEQKKKFDAERKKEAQELASAYTGVFQSMEDSMVDFVARGKTNFKGLIDSMIADLVRYQMRQSLIMPMTKWLDGQGGLGGLISAGLGFLTGGGSAGISAGFSGSDLITSGGNGFGMLSLPHAAAGFDIPRGVNPLTQLHEEEMVLPKYLANPIREMARNGGAPSGTGGVYLQLSPTIDARGADAGAVDRIEQALAELARSVPNMAINALRQAMIKSRTTPQF